jgi:hypothetical protein
MRTYQFLGLEAQQFFDKNFFIKKYQSLNGSVGTAE